MATTELPCGLITQEEGDTDWKTGLDQGLVNLNDRLVETYAGDPNGNVKGWWLGRTIWDTVSLVPWTCVFAQSMVNTKWQMMGVPVGSIHAFVTTTMPHGYLALDGASVGKFAYPQLALVVPTSWLIGNNIVLPDFVEYLLVGGSDPAKVGDLVGDNMTSLDGSHDHGGASGDTALTIAQIPAHTHQYFAPALSGGTPTWSAISGGLGRLEESTGITGSSATHNHTVASVVSHQHSIDPKRVKVIWGIRAF
jgi:hypothetical protein